MGSLLGAVASVLAEAGAPLTVAAITERVLAAGLWQTDGKTPAATVGAKLAVDVKDKREGSLFVRTDPSTFGLRAMGIAPAQTKVAGPGQLTYMEAAQSVLTGIADGNPMHYREITKRAIEAGMLAPNGLTPAATMYSQLLTDIERRAKRGEPPRFARLSPGVFGLASWTEPGLAADIAAHNAEVRKALHTKLMTMEPHEFETLVGLLLDRLGFVEVVVTKPAGDDGVDVFGTLVVGDVVRTRMAVQVKRWKANVQSPVVQNVRGSLGAHDQGLIVTTSDFSPGAREEAAKPDRVPVALMNGKELVALLLEHQIGVTLSRPELYELAELVYASD